MESFRKLGIIEPVLKAIEEHKFQKPSEIQEKSIPLVISGRDVIAGAMTGSGKTLVFGAGIIKNCERNGFVQALVLVPTRELADQVAKSLRMFSKYKPLKIADIYGGVAIGPQIEHLEDADVVVGTPGRILDHLKRRTLDLKRIKILVLDEADRMLDMGFIEDVEMIIKHCSEKRQTLLFSATISRDIVKLSDKYMSAAIEVMAEAYVDPSKLTQIYYDVSDGMKFSLLVHLLKKEHPGLIMVFCNTQRNTNFVAKNLQNNGVDALAIHGGLSQNKRSNVMSQFHAKDIKVLVCTDVAARGLDIKGVSHIYNYDVPREPNQYIHRIGRTARAGKEGKAVSILASRDYDNFRKLTMRFEAKIEKQELPEIEKVNIGFKERGRFSRENFRDRRGGFRERRGDFGERRESFGNRRGFERKPSRFESRREGAGRDNFRERRESFGNRRGFESRREGAGRDNFRESRSNFESTRKFERKPSRFEGRREMPKREEGQEQRGRGFREREGRGRHERRSSRFENRNRRGQDNRRFKHRRF